MDFIEGLPLSLGRTVIFVVVDRLSKYAHFVGISHPYTAAQIAQVFVDHIFKLHGFPSTIVSDRDPTFTSAFWRELFTKTGTELLFSSAYHPQTDGQTENVNKTLETYLRCFAGERPKDWMHWLSLAEFAYNTSEHESTKMTPFEVVYGVPPPRLLPYEPGSSKVAAVEEELKSREAIHKLIQENLHKAQSRMKHQADKRRKEREFNMGDQVYLRLQPYRQMSLVVRRNLKLSPRFYGPYQVTQKIGKVAYKLALPEGSQIHPVFHVSQLKKAIGISNKGTHPLPHLATEGHIQEEPEKVLGRRLFKKGIGAGMELLVKWKGASEEDATWVDRAELIKIFPDLVGKVF